jgi:hypothetical protein
MQNLENRLQSNQSSVIKKIADFGSKYIDYKMGLIGAGIMGSIVFGINYYDTHNAFGATTACLKQGAYTFLFGGSVMKGCEYLSTKIKSKSKAILASVIIPSIATISLTYGMHNLKGTPKPLESTIPTAICILPTTLFWGYRKRKQLDSNYVNLS